MRLGLCVWGVGLLLLAPLFRKGENDSLVQRSGTELVDCCCCCCCFLFFWWKCCSPTLTVTFRTKAIGSGHLAFLPRCRRALKTTLDSPGCTRQRSTTSPLFYCCNTTSGVVSHLQIWRHLFLRCYSIRCKGSTKTARSVWCETGCQNKHHVRRHGNESCLAYHTLCHTLR